MKHVTYCVHLSWDYVPKAFLASCYKMWRHSLGRYNFTMLTCGGCYLDMARDELIKKALEGNPDYILWLDADQSYPKDTPEILMKHIDNGKLVVGGVTPLRRISDPKLDGKPNIWDLDTDSRLAIHREITLDQGLIKIEATGLGGIMMSPEVFKTLEYPWFREMWDKEKRYCLSVDLQFYEHCKKAGIEVWCDTDLVYDHLEVRPVKMNAKQGMVEF